MQPGWGGAVERSGGQAARHISWQHPIQLKCHLTASSPTGVCVTAPSLGYHLLRDTAASQIDILSGCGMSRAPCDATVRLRRRSGPPARSSSRRRTAGDLERAVTARGRRPREREAAAFHTRTLGSRARRRPPETARRLSPIYRPHEMKLYGAGR